jgi:hypothetical protein
MKTLSVTSTDKTIGSPGEKLSHSFKGKSSDLAEDKGPFHIVFNSPNSIVTNKQQLSDLKERPDIDEDDSDKSFADSNVLSP